MEFKILISKVTQDDAGAFRLAKNDPQNTHLKEFYHDVSKAVEKVGELVPTLEANDVLSSSHFDDLIAVDISVCT